MNRRPPRSTLFPNPTLFRSFRAYSYRPERLSAWFAHYRQLHEPTPNLDAAEREMIAVAVSMANGCLYCLVAHGAALRQALDRKSTRLNSSHANISYAVFCLKKK